MDTTENTRPVFNQKKSKFNFFRLLVVALIVLFLTGIAYIVGMAYYGSKPPPYLGKIFIPGRIVTGEYKPGEVFFRNKDEKIILCVGLDESRDEKGIAHHKGSRTDTIFLLRVDSTGKRLGMLSIPRDTWVHLSNHYGEDKINSAYSLAFWDKYEETSHNYELAKKAGIQQVKETVEQFMGVPIDHYVLIKIKAASELVDAIGGLNVDVEKDMDYDDSWGNLHIHLKKGPQKLKGLEVVGYSRFRHDEEGDWGRIRRQQQVINSLVKDLKKPTNVGRITAIADVIKKNIETDIALVDLVDLAQLYKNFDRDNMVKGVLTGDDQQTRGGASIIVPYEPEKERLIQRIVKNPADLKPENIRIRLCNCSSDYSLASRAAEVLKKQEYEVILQDPEDEKKLKTTRIEDHYRNEEAAQALKSLLGSKDAEIVKKSSGNKELNPDFTIIVGDDMEEALKAKSSRENDRLESSPTASPVEGEDFMETPAPSDSPIGDENRE